VTLVASNFADFEGSGFDTNNYLLPSGATGAVGEITQRALAAEIIPTISKVYDGTTVATLGPTNYVYTGLVSWETCTVDQATGTYASKDVGTGIVVTVTLVSGNFADFEGSGFDTNNYLLPAGATGAVGEITQRALAAEIIPTISKVYDGTTVATLGPTNYVYTGLVSWETCTVDQAVGEYASKDVGTGIVVTVTLVSSNFADFEGSGFDTNNYILPSGATGAVGEITQRALAAEIIPTISKVYDGTTVATLGPTNYIYTGLVSWETCTVDQATGVYASKDVGTGIVVTVTLVSGNFADFEGSGFDTNNYLLPSGATGAVGEITQRALASELIPTISKMYDNTTVANLGPTNYIYTGLVSWETCTVDQAVGEYASKDVGTGIVVTVTLVSSNFADFEGSGFDTNNYILPSGATGAVGEITRATLTAEIIPTISKVYDGTTVATLGPTNYTYIGLAYGETCTVDQAVGEYASKDVGTGIVVTVTLVSSNFADFEGSGFDTNNYILPSGATGAVGEITQKALAAEIIPTISKVYDGTTVATLGPTNYTYIGLVSWETCTVSQATGTYASKDVGTGIVVTVTLSSEHFADFEGSGFDTNNYLLPSGATGAVGEITQKALAAEIIPTISKVYDGTTVATLGPTNYIYTGLVSWETCTVDQATGVYASKDVGTGIVVTVTLVSSNFADFEGSGFDTNNYLLPSGATGAVGEITQRALASELIPTISKVYDGTTVATLGPTNYVYTGLVSWETCTVNQATGTYADHIVGTGIVVTVTLVSSNFADFEGSGFDTNNYLLPTGATGAVGEITRATLTITGAEAQDKVYDGLTNAVISMANATTNGVISGDDVQVTNLFGWFDTPGVSTNIHVTTIMTLTGLDKDNYTLTQPTDLSAEITQKALAAEIIPTISKVYDGTTVATLGPTNYVYTGLVSWETCTVSQATGTYASKDVGTGIVVTVTLVASNFADFEGSGFDTNNYLLPSGATGAVGEITQKALAAEIIPTISKVYDGTTVAMLGPTNYIYTGLVSWETCTVSQATGTYASKDVGTGIVVTVTLVSSNFADFEGSGFDTNNYILPSGATGAVGEITQKALAAEIIPTISKVYDGTTAATLGPTNYVYTGLVSWETCTVDQATGTYASKDVGTGILVTVTLVSSNFADFEGSGFDTNNYLLPSGATGAVLPS
jgi:ABC-type xylose transport system substrate-binding protein